MRQLSAVPWLISGGRIALSILCVATLVCGVFGLLKISIGEKRAPNKELTTGSVQRMLSAISCAFLESSVARRFTGTYMFAIANVSRFIMAGNPAFCSLQLILHLVSDHRHRRLLRARRER